MWLVGYGNFKGGEVVVKGKVIEGLLCVVRVGDRVGEGRRLVEGGRRLSEEWSWRVFLG